MSELVSCLCVSRPARWGQLQRAILDFNAQIYPDRELIIVVDSRNDFHAVVQSFVAGLPLKAPVVVLPRIITSALDGLSFAATSAYGAILTLWDDDNLNHPERLTRQVMTQRMHPNAITVFESGFYYFYETAELFPVACFRPEMPTISRVLPSSIMAFRRHFPVLDHTVRARTSEFMIAMAVKSNQIVRSLTDPFMHLVGVTYDGKAVSHLRTYKTHREIAEVATKDVAWIQANKTEMVEAMGAYTWDKSSISVAGSDGTAFTYLTEDLWSSHPLARDLYPVNIADPVVASVVK